MARFKARDIIFVYGRKIAIVTGKILEGYIRIGDCMQIPHPPDVHLSNRIVGIEFFYVLGDSGVIGLAFSCTNELEKAAWKILDLQDKEIESITCS